MKQNEMIKKRSRRNRRKTVLVNDLLPFIKAYEDLESFGSVEREKDKKKIKLNIFDYEQC